VVLHRNQIGTAGRGMDNKTSKGPRNAEVAAGSSLRTTPVPRNAEVAAGSSIRTTPIPRNVLAAGVEDTRNPRPRQSPETATVAATARTLSAAATTL